jgi:DNA-binding response OmpR family regulator
VSRVFVVDDEPDVVELLRTILRSHGFEVEVDTDGRSALTRILADPPDLFILDLMMPDLDGFELLKLLRLDPRGVRIPVLILSARTGHQEQLESLQLGANAYVCKPFSPRELLAQVRDLLPAGDGARNRG